MSQAARQAQYRQGYKQALKLTVYLSFLRMTLVKLLDNIIRVLSGMHVFTSIKEALVD